ncbi:MAG: TldD/PmbA family protein [Thaumarchaeota archaeon]|nr:TldD/PmbA family protein [Nitrososphaerota archaeon]
MSSFEGSIEYFGNRGFDECEITKVTKDIVTIRITDSNVAEIKHNFEENFGVRIIHRKRIISYQTEKLENLYSMLDDMPHSDIREIQFWESLPHEIGAVESLDETFDDKLDDIGGADAADIAQEMINSTTHDKISNITGSLNIISEIFEIGNSHGLYGLDKATYISGMINADSKAGASGFGHNCCRTLDAFSADMIGNDSKEMCLASEHPVKCDAGQRTLVLEPYSVGELLAFVIYPNFGLRQYAEKTSCLTGKLRKKVAAECFTLEDNPHIPQGIGTRPFDDEGVSTMPNLLIEDGLFYNIFSNTYDAFKWGVESTGNASRPSNLMGRGANPIPGSAPHNLRVIPGDMSRDEAIQDTRHGVLVGRLWYTYALNPIRGDFSCTARSGIQLIENGEIVGPVKPVRITHNLPTMLYDISGVCDDEKNVMQWASLPSITPSLRVENVPVMPV